MTTMESIFALFTLACMPISIHSWIVSAWVLNMSVLARATSVRSDSLTSDALDYTLDALKTNLQALDNLNLQLHNDPTNKDLLCKVYKAQQTFDTDLDKYCLLMEYGKLVTIPQDSTKVCLVDEKSVNLLQFVKNMSKFNEKGDEQSQFDGKDVIESEFDDKVGELDGMVLLMQQEDLLHAKAFKCHMVVKVQLCHKLMAERHMCGIARDFPVSIPFTSY
ncbi:hypothetical protein FRB95_011437 [Tulasnella sp. JGI-2019a]|nr:hypothetical protein FRB95_011437 [Tulasnella sp. JGI-2019a]